LKINAKLSETKDEQTRFQFSLFSYQLLFGTCMCPILLIPSQRRNGTKHSGLRFSTGCEKFFVNIVGHAS